MKKVGLIAVILAALVTIASGLTGVIAELHDTEAVEASVIIVGTLDISIESAHWLNDVSKVKPGDEFSFELTLRSDGNLPLDYDVETTLTGDLAGGEQPCYVSEVKIDGVPVSSDSLSESGGPDTTDVIEVTVTMPLEAGNEYEGKSGHLEVIVHAVQQ